MLIVTGVLAVCLFNVSGIIVQQTAVACPPTRRDRASQRRHERRRDVRQRVPVAGGIVPDRRRWQR